MPSPRAYYLKIAQVDEAPDYNVESFKATQANVKKVSKELNAQGIEQTHPLRGVLENSGSSHTAVARHKSGAIAGGFNYNIDRAGKQLEIKNARVMDAHRQSGVGHKIIRHIAEQTKDLPNGHLYEMKVYGAVANARPFYAHAGADFGNEFSSLGSWSREKTQALARGEKVEPGINVPKHNSPNSGGYKRPKGASMQRVAHESTNFEDVLHCPFDGAGQLVGGSDGNITCGYCGKSFIVKIQPQFSGMPQTDPNTGEPVEPGDPDAEEPVDDDPEGDVADPSEEDEADADGGQVNNLPSDADEIQPQAMFVTAEGIALPFEKYLQHLALATASDKTAVLRQVRAVNDTSLSK